MTVGVFAICNPNVRNGTESFPPSPGCYVSAKLSADKYSQDRIKPPALSNLARACQGVGWHQFAVVW